MSDHELRRLARSLDPADRAREERMRLRMARLEEIERRRPESLGKSRYKLTRNVTLANGTHEPYFASVGEGRRGGRLFICSDVGQVDDAARPWRVIHAPTGLSPGKSLKSRAAALRVCKALDWGRGQEWEDFRADTYQGRSDLASQVFAIYRREK